MTERLPDWVHAGEGTKRLFEWLEYAKEGINIFSGHLFIKAEMETCVLIYAEDNCQTEKTKRLHSCRLCGIYRKTDHTLYEAGAALYQSFGIPGEFCFPDKSGIQKELEEKVTIRGRERVKQEWDQLVQRAGFTREELIPFINREQIRMTARRYFQIGKRAEHILYLPRFSFAAIQSELPDELFLQYLEDEAAAVEIVTETWLMKSLAEISRKRIFYGCVREEMRRWRNPDTPEQKAAKNLFTRQAKRKSLRDFHEMEETNRWVNTVI